MVLKPKKQTSTRKIRIGIKTIFNKGIKGLNIMPKKEIPISNNIKRIYKEKIKVLTIFK